MTLADLQVGATLEATQEVTAERTASHIGSGALRVYATPSMVLFVERTCRDLVEPHLAPGQTTVGVELRVRHLAPTPLGSVVRQRAEVVAIAGETIDFLAKLWDEQDQVGEVEHRRRVVDIERFLRRVEAKSAKNGPSPDRVLNSGAPTKV
jgi:predicted thioesterase